METTMINGICRCCASEGAFKDVKSAYQWMGAEEIYADMLKECFDITLWSSGEGDDGGICEVCVTQLRNASNFKKQVLHTEDQFKKHLHTKLFKPSIVKVELPVNDGLDSEDNMSAEEGYSGTDYEVSAIKVESPEETKPKKRSTKMSTRASTSRAKKAKSDAGESSTKHGQCNTDVDTKRSEPKNHNDKLTTSKSKTSARNLESLWINELEKQRNNVRLILKASNATPIRCRSGIGYACGFCKNQYPEAADLKKHTLETHNTDKEIIKFVSGKKNTMATFLIKLDITNLHCKYCEKPFHSIEDFTNHLVFEHNLRIYKDIKNYIMPFKFNQDNEQKCVYCDKIFNKFITLQTHMNTHTRNFVCEFCNSSFINRHMLSAHIPIHRTGSFKCGSCSKLFDTKRKMRAHEKSVHTYTHYIHKCGYCNEKFKCNKAKYEHLTKVHGVELESVKCKACTKTFVNVTMLKLHVRRDHLMERRYECPKCEKSFFQSGQLKRHLAREKVHPNEAGRTKPELFMCVHCSRVFRKRVTWVEHLKKEHGEDVG